MSTLYLGQLGTQACPPPGEVSRASPGRPSQPELYLRTCIPQRPLQQDRNGGTVAGVMSVCLPVWAGPKVTSYWQVVKMPQEPRRGRETALKSDPGSTPVWPWAGNPPLRDSVCSSGKWGKASSAACARKHQALCLPHCPCSTGARGLRVCHPQGKG